MPILRHLLLRAAVRAATDPAVRRHARRIYESELKPRLGAALAEAREAARDNDPRTDPAGFAKALFGRLRGLR